MAITRNNTVSNRILAAYFSKTWRRLPGLDGRVVYVATATPSTVTLIVQGTRNQKLTFSAGQRVIVVGGTFHFPPHTTVFL
ncbi:hypothetical protein [Alicyclobacillus sp. ALC3]|uniref:hypothetical protein n=1 Tax=Alicyclobacillus sp. ALC3 TaxID=2796143 RepID=UPI002378CE0E|nr:hypothetical protein [Alicyclobacillus sp. ALC3]WDL95118.1 hypothetical protein JC200_11820 [Alicyclobacillus sp. ALC3]